jgi:RNA polymerase sigma-70 factor (ECF subfamily)
MTPIQHCLDRLSAGDASARAELLRVSRERLLLLTRKMLDRFPRVRRWEESDDVLQNVLLRLDRTLEKVPLDSPRCFLALAARHIRNHLIDLYRHYYGPHGLGAHHASPDPRRPGGAPLDVAPAQEPHDPAARIDPSALHKQIEALPEQEREAVDLLYFQGMSQPEAAALLGVSVRTIRRHWQAARLRLAEALRGELPL